MSGKSSGQRALGFTMVALMTFAALMFAVFIFDDVARTNDGGRQAGPLVLMALLAEAGIFAMIAFGPIGRAIAKMLEGDAGNSEIDNDVLQRLSEIEYRLGEISGEVARVADIESRVEFSERLLNRLPGGERK